MQKKLLFLFSIVFIQILLFLISSTPIYALNSPNKISTGSNEALMPAIVTDSNGKVHIVWMDAPSGFGSPTTSLLHSYWNGNVWSAPTTIVSGSYNELPSLAADKNGNVYLTWNSDANPSAFQIYYSKYNGTSWSSPVAISSGNPDDNAWDSQITIDSSGNPHVAYNFITSTSPADVYDIYYTKWNGSGWTAPITLSQANTFNLYPSITADLVGKVHVAWKRTQLPDPPSFSYSFEFLHRFWNGTSWSSATSFSGLATGVNESHPEITTDINNNAHVVWQEVGTFTDILFKIMYSKWNSVSWSSPFTVTTASNQNSFGIADVTILPSSFADVLVGWIDKSTTPLKVDFRKYNATSGQWETERQNNINQTSADSPNATIDKWDNIHVAWLEKNASTSKYELFYDAIPLAVNVIGPSGGTITTFSGDTLTIPSGSLSQNTIISAQIAPLSQTAPSGNITPPRQYIFEPTGTVFNPALTAVFKYTDAELAGGNESTLGIYVWDSQTSNWAFKTGQINKPQNKLTVQLDHFSIFGLFATNDSVNWVAPLKVNAVNEFKQGRSLPIKFKAGGTDINLMKVQIIDISANLIKEFLPGKGSENLRYDDKDQQYIINFDTKALSAGTYQVNIIYQGLLKDSIEFSLN